MKVLPSKSKPEEWVRFPPRSARSEKIYGRSLAVLSALNFHHF